MSLERHGRGIHVVSAGPERGRAGISGHVSLILPPAMVKAHVVRISPQVSLR